MLAGRSHAVVVGNRAMTMNGMSQWPFRGSCLAVLCPCFLCLVYSGRGVALAGTSWWSAGHSRRTVVVATGQAAGSSRSHVRVCRSSVRWRALVLLLVASWQAPHPRSCSRMGCCCQSLPSHWGTHLPRHLLEAHIRGVRQRAGLRREDRRPRLACPIATALCRC